MSDTPVTTSRPQEGPTLQGATATDFDATSHLQWRRLHLGRWVLPWYPRKVALVVIMLAVLVFLLVFALSTGTSPLPMARAWHVLLHRDDSSDSLIVWDIRFPRAATGIVVGACLGASGGVFQSMSRNALGSPDVIGFTSGAATGAVVLIVLFGAGPYVVAGGSFVGGLVAAILVYVISRVPGSPGGGSNRLVLVGIGVGVFLQAITTLVLTQTDVDMAIAGQTWLTGSLAARSWLDAGIGLIALVIGVPALMWLARHLNTLELGDDLAQQLGVDQRVVRMVTVVVGVLLVGGATAVAGPIAFVALAAPHLVRLIVRTAEVPVATSALFGACALLGADILGQRLPLAWQLPVGTMTGVLGGVYLIWLLARSKGN